MAAAGVTDVSAGIGRAVTVKGTVNMTRADGTRGVLKEGEVVREGDVFETAGDGAVGIEFADQSTFSLGPNGRVVLDEMIYDPAASAGTLDISVTHGVFSAVSGAIAKLGPEAMVIKTPVAHWGSGAPRWPARFLPRGAASSRCYRIKTQPLAK